MATDTQTLYLPSVQEVIDQAIEEFGEGTTIQDCKHIPATGQIPSTHNPRHWLKIPDVISVFVDMKNSTKMSASVYPKTTTGVYKLFTETAVRILHEFEPAYIDVRGDGVFALFNSDEPYRAFAAAISLKTFADREFTPKAKAKTKQELSAHIGIDQATVLVRKVGISPYAQRTDRQNEVWAGKPVNMASKLASLGEAGELLVSSRYFRNITNEKVRKSCGCNGGEYTGDKVHLWEEVDLTNDDKFDFNTGHKLTSAWCENHGRDFCEDILGLDS